MSFRRFAKRLVSYSSWRMDRALGGRDLEQLRNQGRVIMGRLSYGEPKIMEFGHDSTRLIIGNFTSIARDARFVLGGNHRVDTVTTFPLAIHLGLPSAGLDGQPWSRGDIHVGSDVWVATGATILSGVRIGHGAVVAAGSVVTRDVRPFAVVAGNPAREIRRRFPDEQCEALERIAWWDWDDGRVREAAHLLADTDVDAFVKRYSSDAET